MKGAIKLAYNNLLSFCCYQSDWFMPAKHHALISKALMKVESGEIKKLIITAPPRHGKTTVVSQHFPAWFMGRNPSKKVIITTYAQDLANDLGQMVKDQVTQESYQEIFPDMELSKDSKAKSKFNISMDGKRTRGNFNAVGRGGAITGKGGHLIIVDDLIKDYAEAKSPTIRKKCIDFWKNTLSTRREKNAAIVVMATRWHEEDLIGHLLSEEKGWHILNLPALDEDDNALWPEMYDSDYLIEQRETMGIEFYAQYQGSPKNQQGNLFKLSSMQHTYDTSIRYEPQYKDKMIIVWDTTFKEDGTSYVVGQCWHQKGNMFYLRDQVRGKWGFSKTADMMLELAKKWPDAYYVYVENKANGEALCDYYKKGDGFKKGMCNPIPGLTLFDPGKRSKVERADSVTKYWETGNVVLPENAQWKEKFMEEHLAFPAAKNDDQVDVSTSALILFNEETQSAYSTDGYRT